MSRRIATAALTGRIYMGRPSADGTHLIGNKQDVTSDVLKAVIDKADYHGGSFEIDGGGRKWVVTVSEVTREGV